MASARPRPHQSLRFPCLRPVPRLEPRLEPILCPSSHAHASPSCPPSHAHTASPPSARSLSRDTMRALCLPLSRAVARCIMIGTLTAGQFGIFDIVMGAVGASKFHFHDPKKAH